jgi:uncharacterized membrane protein YgaE (UPF0421/DUF939 family)
VQRFFRLAFLFVFITGLALTASSQMGRRLPEPAQGQNTRVSAAMERARLKYMNKERYEKLRTDTNKLLELATDLKQEVDRADENTLSLEVIRKADEIDKLARSVRDKMKEDIGPAFR